MAEHTLGLNARQGGDFRTDVRVFLRDLEADPAHTRVHGKVEFCRQIQKAGRLGQSLSVLQPVDSGANVLQNRRGEGLRGGVAQNQDGGGEPRVPELQGFQNGADAEEGTLVLEKPGYLYCPVAVGIGLDDCHHRHPGLFPDGIYIVRDGIQVDDHSGSVKIHENQSSFSAFFPFYHRR